MDGIDALDDIATGLYGSAPATFTAARNARAADAADPALAKAVTSLRKPSIAAYAVNALVRADPDQLSQALELAAALREAQDDLDAGALAELTRQRRALVAALAARAVEVAADAGVTVGAAAREAVAKTVNAAMMDAAAADAVMTGRLVRTLEAVGFGEVDLEGAVGGTVVARAAPVPRDDLADRRARKAAEKAARQAAQEASDADRLLARAEAALGAARDRAEHAAERVRDLEADLARAQASAAEADRAVATLEESRRDAAGVAASARRKADATADQLTSG